MCFEDVESKRRLLQIQRASSVTMLNRKAVVLLSVLLLMPCSVSAESSTMTLTPTDQYIAYPGQTVQHQIDVTFTGNSGTTLKLQLQSQFLADMTGNGQELVFENGESKQFLWTVTLPPSTSYGTDTINVTIIDLSDQSSQSVDVIMKITEPSNLKFGNSQSSTFVVYPGIQTNVATNITSNSTLRDDVSFTLETDSEWDWGWSMTEVVGMESRLELNPETMDFVRLYINVPEVIDGAPLANQGPTFRLIGTSGLDGVKIAWDFTLEVSAFRNASIDVVQSDVVIDPSGSARVDVQVRNTGNVPDTLAITLGNVQIDSVDSGQENSDRITSEGWTVALFNAFEDVLLNPNETRTVEIGVQAPPKTTGTISVDLILHPTNFPLRTVRETATVNVSWIRDFNHNLEPVDCTYLQPNATCTGKINIQNIGNFVDAVVVQDIAAPNFVTDVEFQSEPFSLERFNTDTFQAIQFQIASNATAYQQGSVEFNLKLSGGEILQRYSIDVIVGPNVAWSFLEGASEVDSRDVVSFAVQLRNDGNLEDGLIVQLQSSHSTEMGFSPPEGAIIEGDSTKPRTFELANLERGANFTLRGTADLPSDQVANGTLRLDIVVRSIFDPQTEFVYSIDEEFLGKDWKSEQDPERYSISEFFEDVTLILKGWWLVLASIAVAALILNKAVRDRLERKEQEDLLKQIHEKPEETEEDWRAKFHRPSTQKPTIAESPAMPADAFTKAFQAQSTPSAPALEPLAEPIRSAATTVLDHHDISAQKAKMDQIASEIVEQGTIQPHSANENLKPMGAVTERTVRHDNQNLNPLSDASEHVPLPLKKNEEEFDL